MGNEYPACQHYARPLRPEFTFSGRVQATPKETSFDADAMDDIPDENMPRRGQGREHSVVQEAVNASALVSAPDWKPGGQCRGHRRDGSQAASSARMIRICA
jgi:hypothetical protein